MSHFLLTFLGGLVAAHKLRLRPREREVVVLLSEGYTFKEVANKLDISTKTVETHKRNAMQRLGATNRVELFKAVRSGESGLEE